MRGKVRERQPKMAGAVEMAERKRKGMVLGMKLEWM